MKPLPVIYVLSLSLLLSSCETLIVDRPVRRSGYVATEVHHRDARGYRDSRDYRDYRDHDRDDSDRRDRRHTMNTVVVQPRSSYRPQASVRYYNDSRGRYYVKDGRRVYGSAGVIRY